MDHQGLVDLPANPHPRVLLDTLGQGLTDGTQAGDHLLWDFWSLCHADSLPRDTDFGSHRRDRDRAPRLEDERRPRAEPGHRDLVRLRSEEHTSELQSLMRISYAVFCLKKKKQYQSTYQ